MQAEVSKSVPPEPRSFARSYTVSVLLIALALIPLLLWGVVGALNSNTNDPRQWLPRGFHETDTYNWLQSHFGNDEITIVSWPGCTLEDPRVEQLADALLRDPDTSYIERAITGPRMLAQLTRPPVDLPREEAIRRLQGVLIGPDGHTTCLMLTVSAKGASNRMAAVEEIRRVAGEACELQPDELRMGGPTVDAATIDMESQRLLLELASLSGIVSLVLTWLRLRSVRLALIILAVSVYSTAVSLSVLFFTGGTMNLVMTMLPPLIFVLSVSAAIHVVNYYRDALERTSSRAAPLQALHDGWRPCALASGTTAIGLLSLAVSDIVPVRMFGIYAAAGMLASLACTLLLLPVALSYWPLPVAPDRAAARTHGRVSPIDRLVAIVHRRDTAIVVTSLTIMVFTGVGLSMLRSTVKLQYRFGAESRILQDYRWLEEHLGPLVPLELVIHFDDVTEESILDQLRQVRNLAHAVQQVPEVGAALSGADFAPAVPEGKSVRRIARMVIVRRNAQVIEERLRAAGFCAESEQGERLWRISVRASALSDIDYGRFIDTLRQVVDPLVTTIPGARVTYTGVIPLIYKAQRQLLNDLAESFLLAFGVIALVMMGVLADVRAGALAMIPNIFPAVVVFGLMGWCGIWIEIGSIMTASAAMGIAVDDTFHLLTWYRRGLGHLPRHKALRFALGRCAAAMIHTTLVCSCALLVFSFSSFMPIRRFAWLMAALLVAALIGDLILLPAILSSRLGKVVRATRKKA